MTIRAEWKWGEPVHMPPSSEQLLKASLEAQALSITDLTDAMEQFRSIDTGLGPGEPMLPAHQDAVEPRRWDYQPGRNTTSQPRTYEPVSFRTLRDMCDAYDVARIAIEARKDEARGWDWDVIVRPVKGLTRDEQKARAQSFNQQVAQVKGFLMSPNQEDDFGTWLTMYLEDLFVIDAPTIYLRPARDGSLYSLEIVDGATIRPLIDPWGRLPMSPLPAYGQTIKGVTWGYYTRDELIYEPYHQSPTSPYGSPPMSWVLMTANRVLRRQSIDLALFTEGSAPQSIYKVPESWTPAQLKELQEILDTLLVGDDSARSRWRLMPGGAGAGAESTMPEPKTDAEQWLMHITAAAFGTSAYELGFEPAGSGLGGAGFGEASRASAEKRGSRPLSQHIKGLLDRVIAGPLGMPELEFTWRGLGQSEDLLKEAQRDVEYWKVGGLSTDEMRDGMGLDPIGMGPTVFDPKLGVVFVDQLLKAAAATAAVAQDMTASQLTTGTTAAAAPDEQQGIVVPSALPGTNSIEAGLGKASAAADLAAWQRKAVRAFKDGRDPTRFESASIDPTDAAAIRSALAAATTPNQVRSAFREIPS